jgi:hypothetical protein
VKAVANAIPTYVMSIFLLPKSLCSDINNGLRKFWWGFPQDKKHNLSFLSWKSICQPKALGGLGIRSMEFLNNSLLARLGWKMTTNQPLLWVDALRAKYLRLGTSFLTGSAKPRSSWLWKGLLKNMEIVKKGACLSIFNGVNMDIWDAPWIPLLPGFKPSPNANLIGLPDFCVADLILPGLRSWNRMFLQDLFDPHSVQCILNIHLPQTIGFDKWIWAPSPSGLFSMQSTHEISLSSRGRIPPLPHEAWHKLWSLKLQARLKHLLWKIAWDILPSRGNIGCFVASVDVDAWVCPFCKGPQKTLCHIFLECDLARILWRTSSWPLIISGFATRPISDWVLAILYPVEWLAIPKNEVRRFQIFAALTLNLIWFSRNKLIHDALQPVPSKVFKQLSSSMDHHLSAWQDVSLPSLWTPLRLGCVKGNFDVAVRDSFDVVAAVISDSSGNIIMVATQKLLLTDPLIGEASAALLASQLALSSGSDTLFLEGDALLVILAINTPSLSPSWNFSNIVSDIRLGLSSFQSWNALKLSRSANFHAHALAKWAASHLVFGSIPK